jgi:preprotein translocase subunit SecF
MSKLGAIGHRLYTGEVSYDFIGHRRRWYIVSAVLIGVSLLALVLRGLDFGIDFNGGADFKRSATPACPISTTRPSTPLAITR